MATTQPITDDEVHRYADWEVRPRERTLCVRGEPQKIGARAFDVLLALIRNADRTMSRAELLDAAWPGLVVEENNLSVQISTLRRLLGPSAIVNVTGIGYRLAAATAIAPAAVADSAVSFGRPPSEDVDLVGREDEIAALLPRLDTTRLLSIVGTGGVGKSSLARALLSATGAQWRDGVHWIDLAPLSADTDLLSHVGRALGVVMDDDGLASGDVLRSLSRLDALVVLDNCEHLLEDVTDCVAPLLSAAPTIQWLATSQEPLRLQGEEVFRLLPLQVAAADATVDEATSCGALGLLRQRAQAADRSFTIDAANVALALDLCRAFDGLPLAIEMAAARVATLGLNAVHAQLNLPMTLRSGLRRSTPRHHTLLQAYEWSHALLSPVEQRLFRRLQPFQGSFTTALLERYLAGSPEAVEWSDGPDPIDVLAALVDKSLVQKLAGGEPGAETRYRMLESARGFARLQLQTHGETAAVDLRHAEAVASWFDDAEENWWRWRDAQWAKHYVPERSNVVAATAWAGQHGEPALLARLLAAAAQFDVFADGHVGVVKYRFPLAQFHAVSPALRARACVTVGWVHFLNGNRELATDLLTQALADYEAQADRPGTYLALSRLIRLHRAGPTANSAAAELSARLGRMDPAAVPLKLRIYAESTLARHFDASVSVQRLKQLCRLAQQSGFDSQAGICQLIVTDELLVQGRYEEAVDAACNALLDGGPFLRQHATVVHNQALALVRLGRVEEARPAAQRLLRVAPSDAHMIMDLFALAMVQAKRFDDAALLAGRSAVIKRVRHCHCEPAEAAVVADTLKALSDHLQPDELDHLMAMGASMSSDDVLAMIDRF